MNKKSHEHKSSSIISTRKKTFIIVAMFAEFLQKTLLRIVQHKTIPTFKATYFMPNSNVISLKSKDVEKRKFIVFVTI